MFEGLAPAHVGDVVRQPAGLAVAEQGVEGRPHDRPRGRGDEVGRTFLDQGVDDMGGGAAMGDQTLGGGSN